MFNSFLLSPTWSRCSQQPKKPPAPRVSSTAPKNKEIELIELTTPASPPLSLLEEKTRGLGEFICWRVMR